VRLRVVVFVVVPDVPVIVTVAGPMAAPEVAVRVSVLVEVVGFGLNAAVTPLGRPDADKLTLPLNPFAGVTVMVLVPCPPCAMVTLLGETERVKDGFEMPLGAVPPQPLRIAARQMTETNSGASFSQSI
jgi:hypothetical protein